MKLSSQIVFFNFLKAVLLLVCTGGMQALEWLLCSEEENGEDEVEERVERCSICASIACCCICNTQKEERGAGQEKEKEFENEHNAQPAMSHDVQIELADFTDHAQLSSEEVKQATIDQISIHTSTTTVGTCDITTDTGASTGNTPTIFSAAVNSTLSNTSCTQSHYSKGDAPYVRSAVLIGCGAQHSAWQIAFGEVQRQAIYADPKWNNGDINFRFVNSVQYLALSLNS